MKFTVQAIVLCGIFCATSCLYEQTKPNDDVPLSGLLYPRESPSRERKALNGVWNFRPSPLYEQDIGFDEQWYLKALAETGHVIPMPVPSSYNDITQDAALKDYIGWVWYDTEFYLSARWSSDATIRHVLYFGSVHYNARVWLNGISVMNHSIGHLPFEAEVTSALQFGDLNRITVAVNNTLTSDTIPQGSITYYNDTTRYPPGFYEASYDFDFFNYAGIHRPVYLYSTPRTYIDDITIVTDIAPDGTTGIINYEVSYASNSGTSDATVSVELYDKAGALVVQGQGSEGILNVPDAHFWWPYLMDSDPGYLYKLKIGLVSPDGEDIYLQTVGIRTVSWTSTQFLINGRQFYFRGFGKHEDYNIRGKGFDDPIIIKDFNLIKWMGANSFRTSHYPYADEIMDRADAEGIVVIDESPACELRTFGSELLENNKQAIAEMIRRDKNRPSVVMWSIANEPTSSDPRAKNYFSNLTTLVRSLDQTRPLTLVINFSTYKSDQAVEFLDIICLNRYDGWYTDTGHLDVIQKQMETELTNWYNQYNKPIMITEYGADSVIGLHNSPPYVFTEDFQVALMAENFKAFDTLRNKGFFIGELIWNFADFMTPQGVTPVSRVVGNRKGVLTRERQPKAAAHFLAARYWSLASTLGEHVGDVTNEKQPNFNPQCFVQ